MILGPHGDGRGCIGRFSRWGGIFSKSVGVAGTDGDGLIEAPPFVVTEEQIDLIVDKLCRAGDTILGSKRSIADRNPVLCMPRRLSWVGPHQTATARASASARIGGGLRKTLAAAPIDQTIPAVRPVRGLK